MGTFVGIIIAILVVYYVVKLVKLLIRGLIKVFPYLLGTSIIGLVIYGIVIWMQNGGNTVFSGIIPIVLQVLYFSFSSIILFFAIMLISEFLKLIRLRWTTIPALMIIVLTQLALKPRNYIIPNPTSFNLAIGISMVLYFWSIIQFIRIKKNLGFNGDIDSNILVFYGGMGSAFGFINLYLLNFPNDLTSFNVNTTIYLNVLVYISLLIAIVSLNSQVRTFTKVKKYIKQNGYSSVSDILATPLSQESEKEKPFFAEQIILKMKKNKYVYEIGMKKPIYIWSTIYKYIIKELKKGKDINNILSLVEEKYSIRLPIDIIESVSRISGINKTVDTTLAKVAEESTSSIQTIPSEEVEVQEVQNEIIEKELNIHIEATPAFKEIKNNETYPDIEAIEDSKTFPAVEYDETSPVVEVIKDYEISPTTEVLEDFEGYITTEVLKDFEVYLINEEMEETETAKNEICSIKSEFMLLRYNIHTHPITSAKLQFKALYFKLLSYMLMDLKDFSTAVTAILNDYANTLNLKEDNLVPIDDSQVEQEFKKITKKEVCRLGFLKYRLRDYRYILLLEAIYIRYVLTNKIDYAQVNATCQLLSIKDEKKNFIVKYIELLIKENKIADAEVLLMNCKNKHIIETTWSLHNNAYINSLYSNLPKYNVAVCATMSSGKSTFINALLGRDFIPSRNEACTAKITSISDNDNLTSVIGAMLDLNDNWTCMTNINLSLLEEWNNNNVVKKIMLEGNLDGIKSNKGIVVIHDTPGTNYSQNESHKDITMEFISSNPIDMIVYIINAEHISTTDNQILLRQVKAEVVDKQSSKIIFLVNKIDSFDSEKDDDIISCLQGVKQELIDYGYTDPVIIPMSANAARLFKMVLRGQQLSKREIVHFKNLFDLFYNENLDLLRFCDYKNITDVIVEKDDSSINVGNSVYNRSDILIALQRTGITLVEAILDNEINS